MGSPSEIPSPSDHLSLSARSSDLEGSCSPPCPSPPRPSFAEMLASPSCASGSARPVNPAMPRPRLQSMVVAPHGELGRSPTPAPAAGQVSSEWQLVKSRHRRRAPELPLANASNATSQRPATGINGVSAFMMSMRGRCFRCLELGHRVAFCKNPTRCLHCHRHHHSARACPDRRFPRIPLAALDAALAGNKLPAHSRLVFPPTNPSARGPVHSRLVFPPPPPPPLLPQPAPSAGAASSTPTRPSPPSPPSSVCLPLPRKMTDEAGLRRGRTTRCMRDLTPELLGEEERLRSSALILTVAGTCPSLIPANIAEALMEDFPDLPYEGFQVSLAPTTGSFLVRFADRNCFDMVAAAPFVHFHGTPILIKRWNMLAFATSHSYRWSVRLFIEGLQPFDWSLQAVQQALPECDIYEVAAETADKVDLSYFVVKAWVEDPNEVPTSTIVTMRQPPPPCSDPLAHVPRPPGFASVASGVATCSCFSPTPPRELHNIVLVHMDAVTYFPSRRVAGVDARPDAPGGADDADEAAGEERPLPWARGYPDDIWQRRCSNDSNTDLPARRRRRGSARRYSGRFYRVDARGIVVPSLCGRNPNAVCDAEPSDAAPLVGATDGAVTTVSEPLVGQGTGQHDELFCERRPCSPVPTRTSMGVLEPCAAVETVSFTVPATADAVPPAAQQPVCRPGDAQSTPKESTMEQTTVLPTLTNRTREDAELMGLVDPCEAQEMERSSEAVSVVPPDVGPVLGLREVASLVADMQPIAEFIHRIAEPVAPAILPVPVRTPKAPKSTKNAATASRRSRRIQSRKAAAGYTGGNHTLRLARRLIMSKRGLAIAEPGESEDDGATVDKLKGALRHPVRPKQAEALIVLAREAGGKGRRKIRIQ